MALEATTAVIAYDRLSGNDREPAFFLDGLDQLDSGDEAVFVGHPTMR
jgi:hypothetical protein